MIDFSLFIKHDMHLKNHVFPSLSLYVFTIDPTDIIREYITMTILNKYSAYQAKTSRSTKALSKSGYYLRDRCHGVPRATQDALVRRDPGPKCSTRVREKLLSRLRSPPAQKLQICDAVAEANKDAESTVITSTQDLPTSKFDEPCDPCASLDEAMVVAPIQQMPDELMLLIMEHMSDPTVVAFSYTCSRFYRIAPKVVEDVFDRYHYPSESQSRLDSQADLKNCLAGREKRSKRELTGPCAKHVTEKPRPRHKCMKCDEEYDASNFSLAALRGPAETRQCLLHEGRLWNCPEHIWSYELAKALCYSAGSEPHELPPAARLMHGPCRCGKHFLMLQENAIIQAIPLILNFGYDLGRMALSIEKIRPHHSVRFCPHMTMGDPRVWSRFSGCCERRFSDPPRTCTCRMCKGNEAGENMHCSQCPTSFQLRVRRFDDRLEKMLVVYLLTRKVLSNGNDVRRTGRRKNREIWISQSSLPTEFKGLKEEWRWRFSHEDGEVLKDDRLILEDDPFTDEFCW